MFCVELVLGWWNVVQGVGDSEEHFCSFEVRVGAGEGPSVKVKGLITDLINELQAEALV